MFLLAVSPVLFIAAGCGNWKPTTGPTTAATSTSTNTPLVTSTPTKTPTLTSSTTSTTTSTPTPTATATATATSICPPVFSNPTALTLGTAGTFVILGETGITTDNTGGNSSVTGNIGINPNGFGSMTGWGFTGVVGTTGAKYNQSALVTGKIYSGLVSDDSDPTTMSSSVAGGAIFDMQTAYNAGAGATSDGTAGTVGGSLGGLTLERGVYSFTGGANNVTVPTALTLCGGPTDIFIFQIPGTLDVSADIILTGGALPTNVFWIVEGISGATIESGVNFKGILLSGFAINCKSGSAITGGLYAQSLVTLISDSVTQ